MARKARAPWKRPNPRKRAGKASKPLTPAKKASAKARARKAGRRYPNLVDNMRMASASKSSGKKSAKKTSAKKAGKKRVGRKRAAHKSAARKTVRKHSSTPREKDPRGGLTAAGRKAFAKKGAHLRPGVMKKMSEMTPSDMQRKGSWAVRFYGRKKLPPLVDADGKSTRHALSAHAWGEPVPRTVAAARKIAAKGQRLLARYRRIKENSRARSSKR